MYKKGPGGKKLDWGTKKLRENMISRCNASINQVMHKCPTTEYSKGFSKTAASCVELHRPVLTLSLFNSHLLK